MVNRRIGREDSETREQLLGAAEQLMRNEGYAAVTSRKLARHAELKPQLVHYYFRTMDELFEALFERVVTRHIAALSTVARSDDPLVEMFALSCDTSNAVLHLEFLALSNHKKGLREQIAAFGRELNRMESEIIRKALEKEGLSDADIDPEQLATIFETVARGMAFAGRFNTAHFSNARHLLESWLANFGTTYRTLSKLSKLS
ncbi:MAG: TetR/AcrR family transcriptional regulator [Novosphingobium sp.]|nr:TetR/AcrR family transcriptional regulator [Novosphingobium sp.]